MTRNTIFVLLTALCLIACTSKREKTKEVESSDYLVILGTAQDAGAPHIGCTKECCKERFNSTKIEHQVVSLGLVNGINQKKYLFEATPDITRQIQTLNHKSGFNTSKLIDGVFLTHAHIGHYTGLMYFGKEAINTDSISVFAMPKMKTYLEQNGPWSQLVTTKNIVLQPIWDTTIVTLSSTLHVTPFTVPHRDEYSETVGYYIKGKNKTALFIPDIDKWGKWEKDIREEIKKVDYALVDATFYDAAEVNHRDISEIPHPFVVESMLLFNDLSKDQKAKVYFIHFNHTNPLLKPNSEATKTVLKNGFNIAREGDILEL